MDFIFRHQIAFTCIIKDEGLNLKEWLDYHKDLGVTQFYVYDNGSTDNTREILRPYVQEGTVEYNWCPDKYMQLAVYNDAIKKHRFDCKYMGFLDLDEFVLPLKGERFIDVIEDIMSMDPNAAAVGINCKSFGSSGHERRPEQGGVLDNYLYRAPDGYDWTEFPWKWDAHIKTIANPRYIDEYVSPHYARYTWGRYAIDENGNRVDGVDNFVQNTHRIRINHYFTKSLEEWVAKQQKGKADIPGLRPLEEFHWRDRNDVYDDLIVKYWNYVKTYGAEEAKEPATDMRSTFYLFTKGIESLQVYSEQDWEFRIEELLCLWKVCQRRKLHAEDSFYEELLEQIIVKSMEKSLLAPGIDPAQIELIISEWSELMTDANSVKEHFREAVICTIEGLIGIFREQNDIVNERYFTKMLLKVLGRN